MLVLRTRPMLLIFLNCFLQRLPFFRYYRFQRFVFFSTYQGEVVLRYPRVPFFQLTKERFCFFHAFFHHRQAGLRVPSVCQSSDKGRSSNSSVFLHRSRLIRARVGFRVVVLPPQRIKASHCFLSTAIERRLLFRLFHPIVRFIVVVPVRFRPR